MNLKVFCRLRLATRFLALCVTAWAGSWTVHADQIEMANGDRYVGRVLSLNSNVLVLQSDVLGTIRLPRAKIAMIGLEQGRVERGTNRVLSLSPAASSKDATAFSSLSSSNSAPDLTTAMRQLSSNSNMIQQGQSQLLGGAGPEAETKFNDLLGGLMSGKINVDGLRLEAKSTLERAKAARKDLGEEGGSSLDSYLAILENFLKETEPSGASTNNLPAARPKPQAPKDDE